MPDENAFDMLPRIKKARPELPVIVMSAQNTFMTAIRANEVGAYEDLPKPFDLTEVLSVVVSGDTAKVVQRYRTTGTKTSSDGRSHAMEMMARSTDTWIAADGVWRLQETRTDEMEMKADGIQIFRKMRDEN